jgi:hypothetical protein
MDIILEIIPNKAYFDRPATEAEIDREVKQLTSRG